MKLEILTEDEQLANICEEYWLLDASGKFVSTVKEIAARNEMRLHHVSKLVKEHAHVWFPKVFCVRCKQHYKFGTRVQYQERSRYQGSVCNDCVEAECQALADKKRARLVKMQEQASLEEVDLSALELTSKFYFVAAILSIGDEQLRRIEPLRYHPACSLSPDNDYDLKIIRHLIDRKLLVISLNTPLEVIELHADDVGIDYATTVFDITLKLEQVRKLIADFLDDLVITNANERTEFVELCREIQLRECLSFLTNRLEEHQLSMVPGEKTKQVITICLERFSVAQLYNFIWRAVTNAAAYYMRSHVSKRQAANSVVGAITRYMEQAIANEWEVKPFKRNYNLPQSMLSQIVFNTVLNTDDGGFHRPLHELLDDKGL